MRPHVPSMLVPDTRVITQFSIPPRRARVVRDPGRLFSHHSGQNRLIYIPSWEVSLDPALLVLVGKNHKSTQVLLAPDSPHCSQRKAREKGDVAGNERLPEPPRDGSDEGWISGIVGGSKHEVLKHQHAELITSVIESIIVVDSSSPDST